MSDQKQLLIIGVMLAVLVALLGYTIYLIKENARLTALEAV